NIHPCTQMACGQRTPVRRTGVVGPRANISADSSDRHLGCGVPAGELGSPPKRHMLEPVIEAGFTNLLVVSAAGKDSQSNTRAPYRSRKLLIVERDAPRAIQSFEL